MSNERVTENFVRDQLRELGYNDPSNRILVEEQKSSIDAVRRLLSQASKAGGGGKGAPEFIVSDPNSPDFLLIVECKADTRDHASPALADILAGTAPPETEEAYQRRVVRCACDGVLHYARHLSKAYHVVAVAVSGQSGGAMKVSTFLHNKADPAARGESPPKELRAKTGAAIQRILKWPDYIENATFDPSVQRVRLTELMAFSRDLHDFMREHAKVIESQKPLLVSGTLIALQNRAFALSYDAYAPEDLGKQWYAVIQPEIEKAEIPQAKKANMAQPYSEFAVYPELLTATKAYPKGVLNELIRRLNEKVQPFISVYHDFDVVGQFYGEFLKYTGGDKKALGVVLTPRHITELFALLANVNKDSKVLDPCAGTGGFLISAMHQMMKTALTEDEKRKVKRSGLIGVEQLPNMFALAASNMILRGDGKANLYQGSCFDAAITEHIKAHKCDVGMINPPYSQKDEDSKELVFVKHMLDCLKPGGIGMAIIPMSCGIKPHPMRETLLAHHTLEAVMSLPDDLFYPVGIVPCMMVFTAHRPHATSNRKTWFGYWKTDGFVRTKHMGRVDLNGRWAEIRDAWVEAFRNRDDVPGLSIKRQVTAYDEWCAEAYMETDYTTLTRADFERLVKRYLIFGLMNEATEKGISLAEDDAAAEGNGNGGAGRAVQFSLRQRV